MKVSTPNNDIQTQIEGTFGEKVIHIHLFKARTSNKLIINIHGNYGNIYGGSKKFLRLAQKLSAEDKAHVLLYESSRKKANSNEPQTDADALAQFVDKTFQDEVNDLDKVLTYFDEHRSELFKTNIDTVILNGNSFGGIISFFVNGKHKIDIINAISSGARFKPVDMPILSTYPDLSVINETLARFDGDFYMHRGSLDTTYEPGNVEYLYSHVDSPKKAILTYAGVDHSFKKINNNPSEAPYDYIIGFLSRILTGEKIKSDNVDLQAK